MFKIKNPYVVFSSIIAQPKPTIVHFSLSLYHSRSSI